MNQGKKERRDSFLLKPYFCKNRTGLFNRHSGSSAFAQFKWEMDIKWRDKPCEELPWLQWKATCQAPSTILTWTPRILVHLNQDMKDGGLLNFILPLRRAAQGCVTEKQGVVKSYLVFSMKTWTQCSQFLQSHRFSRGSIEFTVSTLVWQVRDETEQIFLQSNY